MPTISETFEKYYYNKKLEGLSLRTLKIYRYHINSFIRELGDIDITIIDLDMIKNYLTNQTHLKNSSLGTKIRFFKSFFRYCNEEKITDTNIYCKLKEPKLGKFLPKALSSDDLMLLEEGCAKPYEHALFSIFFTTGCRIEEVQKMNKSDINWSLRIIFVHGKGSKDREVYFDKKCEFWLKRYLSQRKDNEECLFVSERKPHHRPTTAQLRRVVKRIAKNSEVTKNIYPHILRHSHAQYLLNRGAPMEFIKEHMGHSKIEITMRYAHLSSELKREQYNKYF